MNDDPKIGELKPISAVTGGAIIAGKAFLKHFDPALIPSLPGCYIMQDAKKRPIYVGKAKDLRARLRTYINEQDSRYNVTFLLRRVAHIEFLVTNTEKEALLLEDSLIKQYKPRYNIRLRDDKTYVSLRIDPAEKYPRVTIVRRYRKDGARYFGPYASASAVRETLKLIRRFFPLRLCSDSVLRNRTRPCLYFQMGQCMGPCMGTDEAQYREVVDQVMLVLQGRTGELENRLSEQIRELAGRLEFEQAAVLRDRLLALRKTVERQRTVAVPGAEDRDVVGLCQEGRYVVVQVIFFRGGKMVGGRDYAFEGCEMPPDEFLRSFLMQYGAQTPTLPAEILAPMDLDDAETIAEILAERRGRSVTIMHPKRGDKAALLELAARNARQSFAERQLAQEAGRDLMEQVRKTFGMVAVPYRMECFDISNLQGGRSVGGMAVFENAVPAKARYRRYAIRTVEGQDDFAMLREVLMRRYTRAIEEDDLPDLAVIDGGRGQLNVARAVFDDLGIGDLPVVGIAKSRSEGESRSPERFFLPNRVNPVILPQHSPVVRLLAHLRDEAHRFAISYHRKRRKKATLKTSLTEIPGIGPKRARILLTRLGSLATIADSSMEAIAALPGFNETIAREVLKHLRAGEETKEGKRV
ncbi:MAG TPA: excinuclease ABC subunit UvrC [Candidatus Hydrogenedentes bacterium]|nr:excinuclease ABC subunit UvrC [Candidatus Hydrogenedentota bacterium]HRT63213.1 excinuclease ABC subunit UvrC [Candidatus Hydrogenedentota bacterium]